MSTGRGVYDLRDVLKAAYGSVKAVNKSSAKMGKDFGLKKPQCYRVKWSDCESNSGTGRLVADAAICASVLRNSTKHHTRYPISVDQATHWFEEQAGCSVQPTLLLATVSAHGVANQR